jgi:hypothetical protein
VPDPTGPSTSLTGTTVRRAFVTGRAYLLYGSAVSIFMGLSLGLSGGTAFAAAFPLILPIFGVVGSLGALMVFTSDRVKGVLEYLLAYGVPPRRIFLDTLLATIVLVGLVEAIAVAVGLGVYLGEGHPFTATLGAGIALYSVPMSLASASFAAVAGMYWTTISSPRAGLNSPIGLLPLLGILPPVATLVLISAVGIGSGLTTESLSLILFGSVAVIAIVVGCLFALVGRLLRRERFLSPA